MSNARWCDWGNHPFSDNTGAIMIGQQKPRGAGEPPQQTQVQEMCNECAAELGLVEDYVAPPSPGERRKAMLALATDTKPAR